MFQRFDVISVGDMSIDFFFELSKSEAEVHCEKGKTNCKICLNYADKIPVAKFTKTIGGNAANIAVGSKRLGFKSSLVTTLGHDEEAKYVAKELWREKVDTSYIKQDKRTNVTGAINYIGERTLLVYHEPREYHLPHLPKANFVYLTSMGHGWEKIIEPFVRYLDRSQARLAYNPGTHQLRAGIKESQELLDRTEILFVNKQEAALLLKVNEETPIIDMLSGLHRAGPKMVVITDGPDGSYASDASGQFKIGIFDVPVIERTGCGDSYATGFMAAVALGKDIVEAMRWGSFNAASVLQQVGPQAGLLHRKGMHEYEEKYEKFLAKRLT